MTWISTETSPRKRLGPLEIFELHFVINSWGSQRVPCTWPPVVCAKPAVSGRRGVVHEPPTAANSSLLEATKSFKFPDFTAYEA